MDENVKQALQLILHRRMATKAELEKLRFLEATDLKRSYKRKIDECLDKMNELDELYEKIKNQ